MSGFHQSWGWAAAALNGVVGLWGVIESRKVDQPTKAFYWGVGVAIVVMLAQVMTGAYLLSAGEGEPGNQHVFYGVLIAVTFAFTYIYRAQFRRRPALYYGALLLFTMGLGIRGITTFGVDF